MLELLSEFDEGSPGPSSDRPRPRSDSSDGQSWIQHIRQQVQGCSSLTLVLQGPVPLVVVDVQRYLGPSGARHMYCYDVRLWDGAEGDVWHLQPDLNYLVHRNVLRCGSRVRVTRCSYVYQEKSLAPGVVCIDELEPVEDGAVTMPDLGPPSATRQDPLLWGRKHYIPLWNNQDPYGEIWKGPGLAEERVSVDVTKLTSLQRLEVIWKSRKTFPPLLVRIMYKSRLRYFGKKEKNIDIPYQAYFEVADYSGMMSLVLWNELCLEWFNSLQVGNVILLQQYCVKPSYRSRTFPSPGDSQVKRLPSVEISLNPRDLPSCINVIKEKLVKSEWKLPDVKYQFVTRLELNDLPHKRVCDVIGLVSYVGRCERKRQKDSKEDFWVYRWVQMIDESSEQPFLLEIFATSQPVIFENIHPMSYLVCTQMRVVRESPVSLIPYLTTSNESQVFVTGHHKGQPYIRDNKVKQFIEWMKTQSEADLLKKMVIGGYQPFPLTPETFSQYCKNNTDGETLISFRELKETVENLHYRERKRVAVQGIIAALKSVDYSCSEVSLESKKQQQIRAEKQPPHEEMNHLNPMKRLKHQLELDQSCMQEMVQEQETMPLKSPAVREDAVSNEGIQDVKEYEFAWESNLWLEVKNSLEDHHHFSTAHTESIPCKFGYVQKELLKKQYNLYPAKMSNLDGLQQQREFKPARNQCHYKLTILGINRKAAIDAICLPALSSNDLNGLGVDFFTYSHHLFEESNLCDNLKESKQHIASYQGEFLKLVNSIDKIHVICILDICRLADDKVEVFLNRVYNPSD
ncbi:hypothetical protein GDO86_015305 [Hymenochirus boettgeri]|uniref:RPA1 related single stranded DNA binding protein, X-linked n=1 Tax=Hymenochirus boettgeri TaxID=247094 RepID=A0A8T2K0I6_9PIPI|nr:hypothetical protein GDO86_015305 [Hymenochirus boettgeri]